MKLLQSALNLRKELACRNSVGREFHSTAPLVISRVELIRKDKEKFRSARKIPPSGKQA